MQFACSSRLGENFFPPFVVTSSPLRSVIKFNRDVGRKAGSAFFTGLKTDIKQNKAAYAMGNYCHLELVHIIKWFEVILRTVACTINLL
jgi:hypothetical protein